ncbi:MAG: HAD family hydrolase [Halanaeroarchaeum sp.]
MPGTETVLFDLDGTLCLHEQDHDALLERTFDRVGVEPFADERAFRAAATVAPDADSETDFLANAFEIAAKRAGVDRAPVDELAKTYRSQVDPTAVRFRAGARDALDHVADRPVGLVTNGGRDHQREKLRALGIEDRFDTVVYAGDETPSKPSPEPFEIALDALDARATSTVHVGNSLPDDIAGANGVGLESVWVPTDDDRRDTAAATPTHTIDSLERFPTLF